MDTITTRNPLEEQIQNTQLPHTPSQKPGKFFIITGGIFMVILIGIVVYFLWNTMQNKHNNTHNSLNKVTFNISPIPAKIVFEKKLGINKNYTINFEIWIMDEDGTNAVKLDVPQSNPRPLNDLSQGWVYYLSPQVQDANNLQDMLHWNIYAYNYKTKESKQITENSPANTAVNVSGYVVSPDSTKILYNIFYTQLMHGSPICGQQPCPEADLYPDHKAGTYAYNIETDKKVYLGNFFSISSWDTDDIISTEGTNYHEFKLAGGLYEININTGAATLLSSKVPSSSNDFTYVEHQITNNEEIIIDNLKNPYGGSSQNGDVRVIKSGKQTIVDTTGNICNFSQCLTVSSDKRYALYTKADSNNSTKTVMMLDLTTLIAKPILQAKTGQSFNSSVWISNTQFIIEIQQGSYPNDIHNLYLVDITTGKSKQLTTSNNAFLY